MRCKKDLDEVLIKIMNLWDMPGLAVGIVEGDEIIYAKGFGVQSLDTQVSVTLDSVFCVQSISKCFVATAIMQQVERGILDLDSPIVQYLPYFRMDDEHDRLITLQQALSHTSGIPDMDESEYVEWMAQPEYDDGAAERFVRSLYKRKLVAKPGECFSYSNIAYNVLGDLLAKATCQPFERLMREEILVPAGMTHSSFLLNDLPPHLLAWPHLRSPEMKVNPNYPYHRADTPASFLHTTILDMCHWGITCLKRGKYLERQILSTAGFNQMWTPVTKRGHSPSLYEEMGLGWTLGHFDGLRTISHGGSGFGGSSFFLILPEINYAAVIFCNEESDAHFQAIQAVAETLLGRNPQADTVSWMVPVSQALAKDGIDSAYNLHSELKSGGMQEYSIHEADLDNLVLQLVMANQLDLAIEVCHLNISVFPGHAETYLWLVKLYLKKGDATQAKASWLKALSVDPNHPEAVRMKQMPIFMA
jgi:CubicO group peptidase (beta-lactamase class C family)